VEKKTLVSFKSKFLGTARKKITSLNELDTDIGTECQPEVVLAAHFRVGEARPVVDHLFLIFAQYISNRRRLTDLVEHSSEHTSRISTMRKPE
jgi:hypothetical protein